MFANENNGINKKMRIISIGKVNKNSIINEQNS